MSPNVTKAHLSTWTWVLVLANSFCGNQLRGRQSEHKIFKSQVSFISQMDFSCCDRRLAGRWKNWNWSARPAFIMFLMTLLQQNINLLSLLQSPSVWCNQTLSLSKRSLVRTLTKASTDSHWEISTTLSSTAQFFFNASMRNTFQCPSWLMLVSVMQQPFSSPFTSVLY